MGEKKGFFSRLVEGLTKTRNNIVSGIDSVFHGFSKIDDEFYEELEEILIMGDLPRQRMFFHSTPLSSIPRTYIPFPIDISACLIWARMRIA